MKEGFTALSTAPLTGNRARVRRYRAMHRRIDYVPSFDVLPIIQHHLNDWDGLSWSGFRGHQVKMHPPVVRMPAD